MGIVDTNLWIYAADSSDANKQKIAQTLIARLTQQGSLCVTIQVLNEFFSRATRPGKPPALSLEEGAAGVSRIVAVAEVFPSTKDTTQEATSLVLRHAISIWDALILAAAKENGVATVHTEDLPGGIASGEKLEGVTYLNPFAPVAEVA